ncbi:MULTISPECIES: Mur ligase family protein [unclassified Enterococcus]|uniref:Mur ligase family protein n=1 Tax=unclassified Enterococcus TaxID=2608891 RepID=UPI0015537619|nr:MULTISPECIES: Mur ligase family protein [unclassified Enterococcus]MBS7576614.1 Mur ligase family protein [Enterococcus sp. MMGLQ5-2]MBS7583899.1 Mur ligase family protein [Enterococcus sp. MMGLQ5-1]NPD11760.1 Mur ligase family protein [Enterococcus sp. MMGLQ5-1]NPD36451.1 Mur ligase family protein [Enterococcus sp. MMGLQ5-2]
MSLKSSTAKFVGQSAGKILKTFFKRGSSYPGSLALKIDPAILEILAKDYEIIVVTGTNGKTLTTALIVQILKRAYGNVLTNPTGANMIQGITSTFLTAKKHKNQKNFAVLEIDEASLPKVTEYLTPNLFVFTNIFRDQMDRYGEIYTTYDLIVKGAAKAPNATILMNGDSPIFASKEIVNPIRYYGFNHLANHEQMAHYNTEGVLCPNCQHILQYQMITYANLGKYYCPNCDFKRPELSYQLTELNKMTNESSDFTIDRIPIHLEVGGLYNIYNALAATAVAEYYQIKPEIIQAGLSYDEKVFGRQEKFEIGNKQCTLILVKNPVGTNQVLDMIAKAPYPFTLVTLLNANYADGIDTSWIWDANFESVKAMAVPLVIAGGQRHQEIARRYRVAGISSAQISEIGTDFETLINQIKAAPSEHVYILATYTAMLGLRSDLAENGFIKGGM